MRAKKLYAYIKRETVGKRHWEYCGYARTKQAASRINIRDKTIGKVKKDLEAVAEALGAKLVWIKKDPWTVYPK